MNTVDLGGNKTSSSMYLPTKDGQTVKPNANYLLSFLVSRLNINDNDAVEGDFIRFKTDYAQADKAVTFNKPVVIGNDLFADGEITISDELELYFNGFTWQDSCSSTAPILDVGVFSTSTSKQILVSDLVNTTFDKPLHLIIEVVGGGGGARKHITPAGAQAGAGGGGSGYGAIELVIQPSEGFPVIDFLSGAGGKSDSTWTSKDATVGATSTLSVSSQLVLECLGGGMGIWYDHHTAALGADAIYHDVVPVLYHETVKGNDSTIPKYYSKELSCKYRTIAPKYSNMTYAGYGGYNALGIMAARGGDASSSMSSNGRIQITYRPATADEIAAQEALKAV